MPRATGASRRHSGFRAPAATKKSAAAAATKPQPNPRESIPAGRWRILVRGFLPSIGASTSRLNAMAAERAPIMATTIQASFPPIPADWYPPSRNPSSAPVSAKGRAKTECSNLIMSSVRRRRLESVSVTNLPFYRHAPPCYSDVRAGFMHMLEAFALSDKGCVRTNNEDYCFIDAERGLYVLADGMGGAKAGEHASRIAVETVAETIRLSPQRDSQVLIRAIEEANRRVLEAARHDPSLEGMGTTLVAALELEEELAIASVGDSRAYMFDDRGLHVITDDQTWVNEVGRPLGLDEESLRHHPMRHVLTMAIGASAPLTINHYRVPLAKGNLVLICSDGLHGVLEAPRMEQILDGGRRGGSLEESCRNLIEAAKQAGGPDNVTVVLIGKS